MSGNPTTLVDKDGNFISAANPLPTGGGVGRSSTGYEQLVVSNVAKELTAAEYATSTHAEIAVEDQELRYTTDGTTPTATLGTLLYVGDILYLTTAADIAAFRAIRTGSADSEINARYFT